MALHSSTQFLKDFSAPLDERLYKPSPLLITEDLNIQLDNIKFLCQHTLKFLDLINSHGLSQLVTPPIHDKGHNIILDVVRGHNSDNLSVSKPGIVQGLSDRAATTCVLRFTRFARSDRTFTSLNIKDIDIITP